MAAGRARGASAKLSATERALRDLTALLDASGAPAAVIGGIAVICWGFGRATIDIDAAVALPTSAIKTLIRQARAAGFRARIPNPQAFAEENLVLLLRHRQTGIDVDLSLAQLEFEREALSQATRRPFGAVRIPVPRPTDLVVYKMIAARPRDLRDVEELLARGLPIDARRVEALLREFDALLELDRLAQWRQLRERLREEAG